MRLLLATVLFCFFRELSKDPDPFLNMEAWAQDEKRQHRRRVRRQTAARPGVRRICQLRAVEVASQSKESTVYTRAGRGPSPGRPGRYPVTLAQSLSTFIKIFHQIFQLFTLPKQRVSQPDLQ